MMDDGDGDTILANHAIKCFYLGLDQVRTEVGLGVVDDVVQVEHLVVVVAVGGEVYLNNKVACISPQSFIVLFL